MNGCNGCIDAISQIREERVMGVGREANTVTSRRLTADDTSGSTAIMCLITPTFICTANLGDSRAVLLSSSPAVGSNGNSSVGKGGLRAIPLSTDHKPNLPEEQKRIEAAGGAVKGLEVPSDRDEGDESSPPEVIYRLFLQEGSRDSLALSRALGDFVYKQASGKTREEQMVRGKRCCF